MVHTLTPQLRKFVPRWMQLAEPIHVEFAPDLRVLRGRLQPGALVGREVNAACYLRERRIVLDQALRRNPNELERILVHELCHFIWWKLGHPRRRSFAKLLQAERHRRARGELGWSAERLKTEPHAGRAWSEYCCESFCDTGAWYAVGPHAEVTLAKLHQAKRRLWWEESILSRPVLL